MNGPESLLMKSSILVPMSQEEMPGFVRVVHRWTADERWSAVLCRLGRFGARSRVPPGLYALGAPGEDSAVIVTASYRLTFDLLRRDLAGVSCWILVLDTRGLDVASAAAVGRFSTDELVNRVLSSRVSRVVRHRRIVLPGLAAGIVDAAEVARGAGFEVCTGPTRSSDLPGFLDGRPPASASARPGFTVAAALALAPAELGRSLLLYPGFAFTALLFAGFGPGGVGLDRALNGSWPLLLLGLASVFTGTVVGPLLHAGLPWVPLWGAGSAAGLGAAAGLLQGARLSSGMDPFLQAACWVFFPCASAFLAERFTRAMPAAAKAAPRRPPALLIALAILAAALAAAALVLSKAAELRAGR
jgi:hypothetical protein